MTKYICWSCNKAAKPIPNHDPNSTEVHYLADCCRDDSYTHLESIYPQAVQETLC